MRCRLWAFLSSKLRIIKQLDIRLKREKPCPDVPKRLFAWREPDARRLVDIRRNFAVAAGNHVPQIFFSLQERRNGESSFACGLLLLPAGDVCLPHLKYKREINEFNSSVGKVSHMYCIVNFFHERRGGGDISLPCRIQTLSAPSTRPK